MRPGNVRIYLGSLFVLLISLSLTVSTLHSHNHIEWHHPNKHVDTGTCLIVDSTQCPICGYLFDAEVPPPASTKVPLYDSLICSASDPLLILDSGLYFIKGRSPPELI